VTRTRYGVSPWFDEFPKRRRPDFPRIRDNAVYPAIIIGGGLTGIFSAYAFAAAGIPVAVLEAERIGHRGGARGAGVLQGEAAPSFKEVEARHGRKAARAVFEASRRAVLDLAAAARRLGVRDIQTHDAFRVLASYAAEEKRLARDAQSRRDAGLDITWLKASAALRDTRIDSARAATRMRDWGHGNPYRLLVTFAKAAADRGASIFERSVVRRTKIRRRHVEVFVAGAVLQAETVIVCTGEPTDLYRSLKRHVRLDERYVVMTERLPARIRKQIQGRAPVLTDTDGPPHVVTFRDDGRIVVAGADQPRPPARAGEKVVVQRTGQLMYELSRLFPALSGVMPEYGWGVPIGVTADEVMYAGPHRNFPHHLFAWATRHDPAQAFLASRILLRQFLDKAERDDRYFAFTRG
jgi:glycine/D-amino acid oxidase-like deaminating enzyme